MYFFPAIDLRDGRVVRLTQGDYNRQTTYAADPVDQAKAFADVGATWLHVVDLDGSRSGAMTHRPIIEKICATGRLNVEASGGIRSQQAIDGLLSAGVERVVIGTAALLNWSWFKALASNTVYSGKLVLGLDARKGKLAVSGWEQETDLTLFDVAKRVTDWPLAAIVYTDITVDAMMTGPNIESTRQLAATTKVPIVASGGVGSLDHLRALRDLPIQGAIVGKAIYEGEFTVEQAIAVFERGE